MLGRRHAVLRSELLAENHTVQAGRKQITAADASNEN